MRLLALLAASLRADWSGCLTALDAAVDDYRRGVRCEARFRVSFDWTLYAKRVRPVAPTTARSVLVCVPSTCTPEMVGRYIGPAFSVDGFDPSKGIRIGEASHPGPPRRCSRL